MFDGRQENHLAKANGTRWRGEQFWFVLFVVLHRYNPLVDAASYTAIARPTLRLFPPPIANFHVGDGDDFQQTKTRPRGKSKRGGGSVVSQSSLFI